MLSRIVALLRMPTMMGWTVAICLGVASGLTVWLIAMIWQGHRHDAQAAKVETTLASSRTASAADAIETTVQGAARDAATDQTTRENADAIHHAPGADLRLDPGLNDAGRRGLCRYTAYRSRSECVQLLGPVQP